MNNDEKILKTLEALQAGQSRLEAGQARLETIVDALKAGQDDIGDTMATKADVHDLRVEVVSKIKDHTNRIEDLEKEIGIPHPHKH